MTEIKTELTITDIPDDAVILNEDGDRFYPVRHAGGGVWVQDKSENAESDGWTYYKGRGSA